MLLMTILCNAQTRQVPGYIIKENGTKLSVFFERANYNLTPDVVTYYKFIGGDLESFNTNEVQEFGYDDNSVRFKKFTVDVNKSSFKENEATPGKDPVLKKQTVLLEQLIDGAIDLYAYKTKRNTSYYAARDMQTPELLVYNVYANNSLKGVSKNTDYRRTLYENYGCDSFKTSIIADVDYDQSDLKNYILEVNECNGSPTSLFKEKSNYKPWSLTAGAMANFTSITADFISVDRSDATFDTAINFSPSLRIEYNLDPANNKLSLVGELSYAPYNETTTYFSNAQSDFNRKEEQAELTYNTVGIALGPRYYLYAGEKLRFYGGVQLQYNIILESSELLFDRSSAVVEFFQPDFSFNVMAGIEFNKKVSAEIKYRLKNRFATGNAAEAKLDGNTLSVGLFYRVF